MSEEAEEGVSEIVTTEEQGETSEDEAGAGLSELLLSPSWWSAAAPFIRDEEAALPVELDDEFPVGVDFFFCKDKNGKLSAVIQVYWKKSKQVQSINQALVKPLNKHRTKNRKV